MMVYNNTPAAVFALKKSGIKAPSDLVGKKLGAPVFDAGRKAFPIFAAANSLDQSKINWVSMDPPLRETMLARGDVDAITGFYFTSLLNLNARGVKDEDIVILPYPQYGVKHYGNVIIASEKLVKEKPEVVKAFLRAFTKGVKEVLADPDASVKTVKARDPIIDEALERRRLKLAIQGSIAHRRRQGGRLRRDPRAPPCADGVAGQRCVRPEGAARSCQDLRLELPAAQGRTQHLREVR